MGIVFFDYDGDASRAFYIFGAAQVVATILGCGVEQGPCRRSTLSCDRRTLFLHDDIRKRFFGFQRWRFPVQAEEPLRQRSGVAAPWV